MGCLVCKRARVRSSKCRHLVVYRRVGGEVIAKGVSDRLRLASLTGADRGRG